MLELTVLGSGSGGNAMVVGSEDHAILIDAGFSGLEIRNRLDAAGIDPSCIRAILLSHDHTDHIKGVGVLARRWGIPVYANRRTADALHSRKIGAPDLRLFTAGADFPVGPLQVRAFSIPHDASDPVGFTLRSNGHKLGVATDLGYPSHLVMHELQECDMLVLESNHEVQMVLDSNRPWNLKRRILGRQGHLSNETCRHVLRQILHDRTRHVVLAHASRDCNCYQLIEDGAAQELADLGRTDISLSVPRQDATTPTLRLEATG